MAVCIRGHDEAYCPTWPWTCHDAVWIGAAIKSHDQKTIPADRTVTERSDES